MKGVGLASGAGSVAVAVALTAIALLENCVLPWAPFYVVYAALATWLPWRLGFATFARPRGRAVAVWAAVIVSPLALQLLAGAFLASLPESARLDAALAGVFGRAAEIWGGEAAILHAIYLAFIFIWAGLGEELLYRGYVHGALRRGGRGVAVAAVVSSLLFAVRHATQLALLWPDYPWGAAGAWVAFSFVAGIFFSVLFEWTGSLTAPVAAHYLLNAIPAAALAA